VVVSQLLLGPRHLHPVGEVGCDAIGRAVLRQLCDRFIDPGLFPADDDGAAAARDDVGGRLASDSAAAADCYQFVALKVRRHLARSCLPVAHGSTVAVSPPPHIIRPSSCLRTGLAL
jgi:hypothetical protein